jgi:hypothetical protein
MFHDIANNNHSILKLYNIISLHTRNQYVIKEQGTTFYSQEMPLLLQLNVFACPINNISLQPA